MPEWHREEFFMSGKLLSTAVLCAVLAGSTQIFGGGGGC